jgi:lysophospholipase L1-like esterase
MKKLILFILILTSFTYGIAVGVYKIFPFNTLHNLKSSLSSQKNDNKKPNYIDKVSFFETFSRKSYDVVFIGDSITDSADWYDIFQNKVVANRGISGDTTDGVLARMDSILNTNAYSAFVMIGINDINNDIPIEKTIINYLAIIKKIKDEGMQVFVQSTLFTSNNIIDNSKVLFLNEKIEKHCRKENIKYINLNSVLAPDGNLLNTYTTDGIHLNNEGYIKWANMIKKYIES